MEKLGTRPGIPLKVNRPVTLLFLDPTPSPHDRSSHGCVVVFLGLLAILVVGLTRRLEMSAVDDRGFSQLPLLRYSNPLYGFAFRVWHSPMGYNLRRFSPSLEFDAFIAGVFCYFGWEMHPYLLTVFGVLIPLYKNAMQDGGGNDPYTFQSFLHSLKFLRPHLVFLVVYTGPVCFRLVIRALLTPSVILGISFLGSILTLWTTQWPWKRNQQHRFKYSRDLSLQSTSTNTEIRLLEIHRWIPFLGVRSTLHNVSLQHMPSYDAISYTWGDSLRSHMMKVNGLPFQTTAATYNALYNCSQLWGSKLVWIDYICINQSDDKEKSAQVPLMKDIYSKAHQVIVCISDSRIPSLWEKVVNIVGGLHDSRVAIDMIKDLGKLITENKLSASEFSAFISREQNSHRIFRWRALQEFLANKWFGRVWVVQEVAVNSRVTFLYENCAVDWNILSRVMHMFQDPELAALLSLEARENNNKFHVMARIRSDIYTIILADEDVKANRERDIPYSVQLPLAFLLSKCDSFEATDGRDKVYALLGLATDESSRVLAPSYETKSTRDVFVDTARYILNSDIPFIILSFAGLNDSNPHDLPSWVPDWTSHRHYSALDLPLHHCYQALAYNASGSSQSQIIVSQESDRLILKGACIDTISVISSICNFDPAPGDEPITYADTYNTGSDPRQIRAMCRWHDEALTIAQTSNHSHHRSKYTELLWRTLVGDQSSSFRPASANSGDDYQIWLAGIRSLDAYFQTRGRGVMPNVDDPVVDAASARWGGAMGYCVSGRRVAGTKGGYLGCVPPGAKVGDIVALIFGASTPVVLRIKEGMEGVYSLVGECYVDGIMDGEIMGELNDVESLTIV